MLSVKVYDEIIQGLNEAIAYNDGKIEAKTKIMSVELLPDFKVSDTKSGSINEKTSKSIGKK